MENETWLPVVGYENLYEVSNLGQVRSVASGRVLRPSENRDGYLQVGLYKNGKQKMHLVHRLVATAHIPNPNNLPIVNHKNEIKGDPRASNLEWCTAKYNRFYGSLADELYPVYQFTLSGEFVAAYPTLQDAVRATGVPSGSISMCCHNKRLAFGGYQWRRQPSLFLDSTEYYFNNTQPRTIYQYDAHTGRFVKEWASALEAYRKNIKNRWRYEDIVACAQGVYKSIYGYRWFYSFQGLNLDKQSKEQIHERLF